MGRYDTSRSLRANVDISPPIMSRFDLFFVVVDECDETIDTFIAEHIVGLHRNKKDAIRGPYTISDIQQYIRFARSIKPKVTALTATSFLGFSGAGFLVGSARAGTACNVHAVSPRRVL